MKGSTRSRGWFGVGIERPKNEMNLGTLWRSAACFDAALLFTIGRRCRNQASDTGKSWRQVPHITFPDVDDFHAHIPYSAPVVGVELTEDAAPLERFRHPDHALYLLGPEDGSLSAAALAVCHEVVKIDTRYCLNVATAGSVVMYDRAMKRRRDG